MTSNPFAMTGDDFLDGALYARGSRKSLRSAELRVSELPAAIADEMFDRAEAAGLSCDYQTRYEQVRKDEALVIEMHAQDDIFRPLIAYGERRLPADLPLPFLDGYFTTCSNARMQTKTTGGPALTVRPWHKPMDDVTAALSDLGVEQAIVRADAIYLEPSDFDHIPSLKRRFEQEAAELHDVTNGVGLAGAREQQVEAFFQKSAGTTLQDGAIRTWARRERIIEGLRVLPKKKTRLERGYFGADDLGDRLRREYMLVATKAQDNATYLDESPLRQMLASADDELANFFRHSHEGQDLETIFQRLLGLMKRGVATTPVTGLFADTRSDRQNLMAVLRSAYPHAVAVAGKDVVLDSDHWPAGKGKRDPVVALRALAPFAYRVFKGLTFDEAMAKREAAFLDHCGGCQAKDALTDNDCCHTCSTPLCSSCGATYRVQSATDNPFAASATLTYCPVHFSTPAPKTARFVTHKGPKHLRRQG